jgi:TonB family protein
MKVLKPNPKAQQAQPVKRPPGAGGYRIVSFPKEFEKGLFGNVEGRFYMILGISLVVVYSLVITMAHMTYTDEELALLLREKYIQKIYDAEFVITETEEVAEVSTEGAGEQEEEKVDERAKENVREEASGTSAAERREQQRRDAARRASARNAMQDQVAGTGVLAELSAGGSGGSGDAVYDVLGDANTGLGNLNDVLSGVGGLQSASSSNRRSSLGERAGSGNRAGRAGIDDLISTGTGQSGSVNINRNADFAIKGVEGSLSGKGTRSTARSQDAIGRVVGQHSDAIESCYKRESRLNPNLQGSVTVQFTIDPDGRVAQVRVVDSSLRNKNVEDCISKRIRTWRFDKIPESDGAVQARYKWIFSS